MVTTTVGPDGSRVIETAVHDHAHHHALCWSAIIAGAFAAAALALILIALGFGLGLSSVSPWAFRGVSSNVLADGAIAWLVFSQIVASGMGGFLAGRLRHRWGRVHMDEVHFRDTAQGFLAWSVGIVFTAAFLASAGAGLVGSSITGAGMAGGHAMHAAGGAAGPMGAMGAMGPAGAPMSGDMHGPQGPHEESGHAMGHEGMHGEGGYQIGQLFRSDKPLDGTDGPVKAEAGGVFMHSMMAGSLSPADRTYLGTLVATRTGLSQADAEKRVQDTYSQAQAEHDKMMTEAKEATEAARKAAAHAALWLFIALLAGAFSASFFATIGGHHRDTLFPYVGTTDRV